MRIQELMESQHRYLHAVRMRDAITVLSTGQFKANPVSHTGALVSDGTPARYAMSVARDAQSAFFEIFVDHYWVVFELDGRKLTANYASQAYAMPGGYDEREDRVYSSSPAIAIRGRINQTILAAHFVHRRPTDDMDDEDIADGEEQVGQFVHACLLNHIPMIVHNTGEELRTLKGGEVFSGQL